MTDNSDLVINALRNIKTFDKYTETRSTEYKFEFDNLNENFKLWLEDVKSRIKNGLKVGNKEIELEGFSYCTDSKILESNKNMILNKLNTNSNDENEMEKQLEIYLKENKREGRKRRKNISMDCEYFSINKKAKLKIDKEIEIINNMKKIEESFEQFVVNDSYLLQEEETSNNNQKIAAKHDNFNEVIEEMPSKEEEIKISFIDNPRTSNYIYNSGVSNLNDKITIPALYSEIKKTSLEERELMNNNEIGEKEGNSITSINKFNLTELLLNLNESDFKFDEDNLEKIQNELHKNFDKKMSGNNKNEKNNLNNCKSRSASLTETININNNLIKSNKKSDVIQEFPILDNKILNSHSSKEIKDYNKNKSFDEEFNYNCNYNDDELNKQVNKQTQNVSNNLEKFISVENLKLNAGYTGLKSNNNSVNKINPNNEKYLFTFKKDINKVANSQISNLVKDAKSLYTKLYNNDDNNFNFQESPAVEKWNPSTNVDSKGQNMNNTNTHTLYHANTNTHTNANKNLNGNNFTFSNSNNLIKSNENESKGKFLKKLNEGSSKTNTLQNKLNNPMPLQTITNSKIYQVNNKNTFQTDKNKQTNLKIPQNLEYEITDKSNSSDTDEDEEFFNILDDKSTPFFSKATKKKKKIPQWADSKDYINKRILEQRQINYKSIFGVCKIDNLDLNTIFTNGKNYDQVRGDSADWRLDNTYSTNRISSCNFESDLKKENSVNNNTKRALIDELNDSLNFI